MWKYFHKMLYRVATQLVVSRVVTWHYITEDKPIHISQRLGRPKFTGSRPDEVNEFYSLYLIRPDALRLTVYSAPNRNEYQKQKNNISAE
jgi:hypothetical protein